jgi:hypothetical protein
MSTATFIFISKLQRLFYFMPRYILVIIFIMHHLFLHLLQHLLYVSTFVCPGHFLFFFNFFKLHSKSFFTVQYFLIQSRIIRLQL